MSMALALIIIFAALGVIVWMYYTQKSQLDQFTKYIHTYEEDLNIWAKNLEKEENDLTQRKIAMEDYYDKRSQIYKVTSTITETPVEPKSNIIADGEHSGRKYSKSNDRKRSGKKAVVDVPKKTDNTKRAQSSDETVPPANSHVVDIETYDTSSKSCAPSVSYRQSCSSPVESYSSGDSPSSSDFSSMLD